MDSNNSTNIEKLKSKWEQFEFDLSDSNAANIAFTNWEPGKNINEMKLDEYTNLLRNEGVAYFTNWMERKTEKCGKFRTGSTFAFGIYRENKIDESYKSSEQRGRSKDETPLNRENADKVFTNTVRPVVASLAKFEDRPGGVTPLEINYARKIAYMYNPDKLLPIFKKEVIEAIAFFLNIEVDTSNYKATKIILDELIKKWELGESNFALTQKLGTFMWNMFGKSFSLNHKNIIFYGAPGTGKTYTVLEGIKQRVLIANDDVNEVLDFAQFHPSYSYEDFIEGFKPVKSENGGISLELRSGRFKQFCKKAMKNLKEERKKKNQNDQKPKNYYFVADEINRAELSRVLGEVLVCLEESKRINNFDENGKPTSGLYLKSQYGHLDTEDQAVLTINGEHYFGVPSNLYFVGTMNDIDRSIDSFDLALRRRFVWQRMDCDYSVIKEELANNNDATVVEKYAEICERLNELIAEIWELGQPYQIGHAYFLEVGKINAGALQRLFDSKIKPLLNEYLRAEYAPNEIEKKLKEAQDIFILK